MAYVSRHVILRDMRTSLIYVFGGLSVLSGAVTSFLVSSALLLPIQNIEDFVRQIDNQPDTDHVWLTGIVEDVQMPDTLVVKVANPYEHKKDMLIQVINAVVATKDENAHPKVSASSDALSDADIYKGREVLLGLARHSGPLSASIIFPYKRIFAQ